MRARDMIRARAKREPAFRDALYQECLSELRGGNPDAAEHMLREYLELPDREVWELMSSVTMKAGSPERRPG